MVKNRLDNYLAKSLKLIKDPTLFPEGIGSYILEGHEPVPEPELLKWAKWLQTANRRVAKDIVIKHGEDAITVSTVFLGLDYQFNPNGPPLLLETMIFGGEFDLDMYRYSTWDEAVEGHSKVAEIVKQRLMINTKKRIE